MTYIKILELIQSIIKTINNGNIFVGLKIQELSNKTLSVKVVNPQTKVQVEGTVVVDQTQTQNKIGGIALAINELKKALKPKDSIKVSNFPKYPEFPKVVIPKEFSVSNFPKEIAISDAKKFIELLEKQVKAVEGLKLDPKIEVKPPVVNVPAPIVNVPRQASPVVQVEAPDLSEFKKIMKFLDAINAKNPIAVRLSDGKSFYEALKKMADIYAGSSFSAFQDSAGNNGRAVINNNNELQVTMSETWDLNNTHITGNFTYLGQETVDGRWRVNRVEKSGEYNIMRYATSKNNPTISSYDEAWDSHESLTFDRVSEAL